MNCIVIDDEATARVIISQLCSNVPSLNVLEDFPNAMQAIKYLNQNEVDLIFLDIHMPDFTGFDFIDTLKNPPKIILTTSDPNFAIQAFEYDCIVDYLVKPVSQERFDKAILKAEAKQVTPVKTDSNTDKAETTSGNHLYVNIDRRLIKIDIPSIYLVEAKGDYIK
ncbi:two-component system response regulator [Algibacter lectus]|uniref:Two-component system response regulator n=1 Tax=Algibacter lectus TaxID=221126 RepID=A0A090WMG5_9FLAO|nr:two-component system response regulator [Algibacter lectus]